MNIKILLIQFLLLTFFSFSTVFAYEEMIDNFDNNPEKRWIFFADTVMGGKSSGNVTFTNNTNNNYLNKNIDRPISCLRSKLQSISKRTMLLTKWPNGVIARLVPLSRTKTMYLSISTSKKKRENLSLELHHFCNQS